MGLSNYLPSSRIAQPGVCTSSTRPASPFEGQVIYETDTNRVLVWEGSAWVMIADTDSPPGLELVKTQTIGTTVSSVEVTSAFSSSYDQYLITVSGGTASTSNAMTLKLGSTTTGYYEGRPGVLYSTGGFLGNVTSNGSLFYIGQYTTTGIFAHCILSNPYLATETRHFSQYYSDTNQANYSQGVLNNTTQYTSFTIATAAGTLTGGTIRVYGYRNSI